MSRLPNRGCRDIHETDSGPQLMLGPVNDFIYRIHGDKSILICFQNIIHQGYILVFINNGDDLPPWLAVIGSDGFINRGAAVEMMQDKLPDFFLPLGNDSPPLFNVKAKDDMVQHDSVEIGAKDTEHYDFLVIDQGRGQCHTHA